MSRVVCTTLAAAAAAAAVMLPALAATSGQASYQAACAGCHGKNLQGGVGPALTHEGTQRSFDWIVVQIQDPAKHKHHSPMPTATALGLSNDQVNAIATYLSAQK